MKTVFFLVSVLLLTQGTPLALADRDHKALAEILNPGDMRRAMEEMERLEEEEQIRRNTLAHHSLNYAIQNANKDIIARIASEKDEKKKKALDEFFREAIEGYKKVSEATLYISVDDYEHGGISVMARKSEKKVLIFISVSKTFIYQYSNDPEFYNGIILASLISLGNFEETIKLPISEQLHAVYKTQARHCELVYPKNGPHADRVARLIKATKAGADSKEFAAYMARESLGRLDLGVYSAHEKLEAKISKLKAGELGGSIVLVVGTEKERYEAALKNLESILKKIEDGDAVEKHTAPILENLAVVTSYASLCKQTLNYLKSRSEELKDENGFTNTDAKALREAGDRIEKITRLVSTEVMKKAYRSELRDRELTEEGKKRFDAFKKWLEDQ